MPQAEEGNVLVEAEECYETSSNHSNLQIL